MAAPGGIDIPARPSYDRRVKVDAGRERVVA
jgi:hypothetical protein